MEDRVGIVGVAVWHLSVEASKRNCDKVTNLKILDTSPQHSFDKILRVKLSCVLGCICFIDRPQPITVTMMIAACLSTTPPPRLPPFYKLQTFSDFNK